MTQPNPPPPANPGGPLERKVPGRLWITFAAFGLITVLTLVSGLARGSVTALVAGRCNLGLLLGLVLGYQWAYVLLMVFSVMGMAVGFGKGAAQGLLVLTGNAVVVVPVLLSTHYFSRREQPPDFSREP